MSSVLSEYPETLPAPMVGVVNLTERRKISTIGTIRNTRNVQRDRHGTRTVAFVFTPAQAAIFREWWVEWEQRGGGWFAANWPLPWQRGSNVFRFMDPPAWQLIGGGIDGQGYWSVRATVEIRGRGMLPTVDVLYLTSTPYPVVSTDAMQTEAFNFKESPTLQGYIEAMATEANVTSIEARDIYQLYQMAPEALGTSATVTAISSATTAYVTLNIAPEGLVTSANVLAMTAYYGLIRYENYRPEALSTSATVTAISSTGS